MSVVIIPAYQPDSALVEITERLWEYGCRMIVVDDGSSGECQQIFRKIQDICIVLHHPGNRGKGAAIKTALSYIQDEVWDDDVIGIMDSDGQHLPEDMIKLLRFAEIHRNTFVLGVRTVGKEMPLRSWLGNRITRVVFRMVSGTSVSDTQTGLRAFGSELAEDLISVDGERYEYEMNVLMICARRKIPILEIPVSTIYLDSDNSCSHFRSFRDSFRIYKDILKFALSSVSGFLLDYVLFLALVFFLPRTAGGTLLANISARLVSAFYNYHMNCRFVFHEAQGKRTCVSYFALAGLILILNSLILELFTQGLRLSVYPAKLLTEGLLFVISWLVQRYVIFRENK